MKNDKEEYEYSEKDKFFMPDIEMANFFVDEEIALQKEKEKNSLKDDDIFFY